MEAIEQAEGEKRVQAVLIAPLLALGLAKPSPLMLDVFGSPMGREAISKGWAPELLVDITANRKWPRA